MAIMSGVMRVLAMAAWNGTEMVPGAVVLPT